MSKSKYYIFSVKFPCGKIYDVIRYSFSLQDAMKNAYGDVKDCEVLSGREATEFEIEGKHKGVYLL